MKIGVNVPNFGPGTDPAALLTWARTVEGLGFDLLMVSDHVAITPDVAVRYPAPFYEPFTTLAWLAAHTDRVRLGTTVLIAPYRHPLLTARTAANLDALSGHRLVLGVGIGWARQEFAALGVPFEQRGRLTDEHLRRLRTAWADTADYGTRRIPLWVGGNSDAGLRRAVRLGDAWHPLRPTTPWLCEAAHRLRAYAEEHALPVPAFAPRIALRLTPAPVAGPTRLAGEGSIEQISADLARLRLLGADTVVLDPYHGDPEQTRDPAPAREALAAVADLLHLAPTRTEQPS
ncbi:Flavin-dependent oxidoreductase, luciferase family (includes alkanesulfonate monooxygenase SsuD and methylene tetrahydromethanopterin reductase) [Streptomyces sp. TLI_053]|uniref:LLM class flavin-dependent oxidoreductase n=1 Tax=Streptomyces sp. TLI_053 TaxID=1855352 RepID=UPI00087D28E6|nr:LLM class flavin-dependent oxidoreductase [Streptomyces sp. TLI_053]SDT74910.1 Flavin-dependent oxidoreductase, luciferase family (includes alkanesulfonate monooxygenase SsuD and methylene tetrahydromethanopterin reductase) [Streptomyces sp. TLI_053]